MKASSIKFFTVILKLLISLENITECFSASKQYTSYTRTILCNPSEFMRYPKTTEEVVAVVKEGIQRDLKIKPIGFRHSQTDIICTDGIPVETSNLKYFDLNPVDGLATFGAGVSVGEAAEFLRLRGRAFKTMPAYGGITIGGTIGTGAHGSTIKHKSSLSSQVVEVVIVDGAGNVRQIKEEEELRAFRVHLGLLGFIVQVTFQTYPVYKVHAHNYINEDNVLQDGSVQRWLESTDQLAVYWFPSAKKVVVGNWTILNDLDTPGNAYTNDHVPSTTGIFNMASSALSEFVSPLTQRRCTAEIGYKAVQLYERRMMKTLYQKVPDFVPIYTEDGITLKNPAVGFYDKMFAPPTCKDHGKPLQCLWSHGDVNANISILDNEVSVPLTEMPNFIQIVKDIVSKAPALFMFQGILMRFSAKSETYMDPAYGRDTVHFEFYVANRKNKYEDVYPSLAAYQTIMQIMYKKFDGRSHWGKSGPVYHTKEMIEAKLDSEAKLKFIEIMKKYDPNGIFLNNFGRRLLGLSVTQDLDPLETHCAIRDNCFCSADHDCATHYQRCTSLPGYEEIKVCQSKGDSPEVAQSLMSGFNINDESLSSTLMEWADEIMTYVQNLMFTLFCLIKD